ncbi:MAG: hypothetical protein WBA13_11750 [Microcoleaceae cyanobacterium]
MTKPETVYLALIFVDEGGLFKDKTTLLQCDDPTQQIFRGKETILS